MTINASSLLFQSCQTLRVKIRYASLMGMRYQLNTVLLKTALMSQTVWNTTAIQLIFLITQTQSLTNLVKS